MRTLRRLLGPFFVVAGALHFLIPRTYRRIMPPWVPAPQVMVYASGAAEIAGGVGMMIPARRRLAGWWLIATMVGVFPANLHMAFNAERFQQVPGGAPALWARLPFQGVFIVWILDAMRQR
jgi:uncharacterized membrane protein